MVEGRLQARLLEFLKFRVLAAQEGFFSDLERKGADGRSPQGPDYDLERFRSWLGRHWPEALALDDASLARALEQARRLYVD